ncbi:MAG TPA: hypothetical protein VJ824_08720 [Bacillota bacterium]|nr:hypothetical protein [Bacillota bacterium]
MKHLLNPLIHDYIQTEKELEDNLLNHYTKKYNYDELIKRALLGTDERGKKHPHKYRIDNSVYPRIRQYLLLLENKFNTCSTFDEVMKLVYEVKKSPLGSGFGSVSIYDTALCLAVNKKEYPKVIYLHAGAYEGAENLFGKRELKQMVSYFQEDKEFPYLSLDQLPKPFKQLQPHHIENFFCIYRSELKEINVKLLNMQS